MKNKTYKLSAREYSRYYHLLAFEKQAKGFKRRGFFYGIYLGGGIYTIFAAFFGLWGAVGYFILALILIVTYPLYKGLIDEDNDI